MIMILSQELIEILSSISGRTKNFDPGKHLFYQGDRVKSIFIVKQGLVELVRNPLDDDSIILQRASTDIVLAEASVYSSSYHCDAVGVGSSEVWAAHLAREIQNARYRSKILSRKMVTSRLMVG